MLPGMLQERPGEAAANIPAVAVLAVGVRESPAVAERESPAVAERLVGLADEKKDAVSAGEAAVDPLQPAEPVAAECMPSGPSRLAEAESRSAT